VTIAAKSPSQKQSAYAAATSVARAYPNNVAAGSLLTITGGVLTIGANDPPTAGDLTKSAGTATLGTVSRDAVSTRDLGGGYYIHVAQFSVIVSGAGSLTVTLAGGANGASAWLAVDEYTGTWDDSRLVDTAAANGDSAAPDSGNADSAAAALFFGGLVHINAASGSNASEDGAFSLIAEQNSTTTQVGWSSIARIVTGATTDAASWTTNNPVGWAAALAVYREVAPKSIPLYRRPPGLRPAYRFH
jgi:hypothetical protein